METNAKSTWLFCKEVIPNLLKQGDGNIVNVSSAAGLAGYLNEGIYCMSHVEVRAGHALGARRGRAEILINGELHARVGRHETTFMTQPGPAPVTRSLYRRAGERNGAVVDPVSLRAGAGAVDGVWLPGAARDMAYLLQQGTSREADATARELGGCRTRTRASSASGTSSARNIRTSRR